jgi:radical SAM superfamily enzyme YgiQ (UPF0313 family)
MNVPPDSATTELRAQTFEQPGQTAGSLGEPGRILLVSCYELGHQPLNLAFPLAYLEDAGYQPAAVDISVEQLDDETICNARFVAVSVPMHTALRLGEQVVRRIRKINPDITVCFYGLYAWMNADYLLREHADAVIGGEYEQPLLELIQRTERGGAEPIDGVGEPGRKSDPSIIRIRFPEPDRSRLPAMEHYAHLLIDGKAVPAGYAETTRGCAHTCLHCPVVPIYHGRFFAIPREVVLNDIRQQVQAGAGHITFGDPDFLNGPTHALRVCRALHEEFPHVTFDMTTRIEHILENRDRFQEFAELGCVFVISAVESISETVLAKIDKGHTKADVVEALHILEDAGIAMRPSLLPFTPWTTIDDYIELLEFAEEHDLIENIDPVHFSIRLLVPPESALLSEPDANEWVGELDEAAYSYTWSNPDPRVDALQREIARIVEAASACDADPYDTFEQIRSATYRIADIDPPAQPERPRRRWRRPPRLTESWFC